MKDKIKRLLCFLTAAAIVFLVSACKPSGRVELSDESGTSGSNQTTDSDDENGENGENGEVGSGSGTDAQGNPTGKPTSSKSTGANGQKPDAPGKPVVTEKDEVVSKDGFKVHSKAEPFITDGSLTINVMLPAGATMDISKQGFAAQYEKKTGVKVKYQSYEYSQIFVVLSTLIQSGNMPDIFGSVDVATNPLQVEDYGKQGFFADIAPYMATWSPNLNYRLQNSKTLKKITYTPDGKMYGLPCMWVTPEEASTTQGSGYEERQLMINTKWLKELGLNAPKTTDEFYNVANAFTTQDPNGNGKQDEYGFGIPIFTPQLWNPWGLNMHWYHSESIDEKGNIHYGPLTEQFREGARYWNRFWTEPRMWNKNILADPNNISKADIQLTGIVSIPTLQNFLSSSELDNWTPIAWPQGKNTGDFLAGCTESQLAGLEGTPNVFFISSKTKSVEACLRWMDYFYTLDGAMMWHYGPEGKAYSKVGDNYKLFKNANELAISQRVCGSYTSPMGSGMILKRNASELNAAEAFLSRIGDAAKAVNRVPKYSANVAKSFINAAESKQISALRPYSGDIQWGYQAIQGEKNADTDWNSYISQYPDYSKWKSIMQNPTNRMKG